MTNSSPSLDELMQSVYAEMKRLAASQMNGERRDHTLQPTALVHEVYLRLAGQQHLDWRNRAQLLGLAAQMMRRILLDHAASHRAAKRWGGLIRVPIEDDQSADCGPEVQILDLDRALRRLAEIDPQQARVVELRFFGGLTAEEAAESMDISVATIHREWATARLWLLRHVSEARRQ
ncbi:ECF-type sigma factor [uncultured Paludibaculum sp.]|uniref:ECF-type sigma factor n=1 Tax=uncultured Paludibaculum sp. TaxID=1765020 RepID=UPI002AABAFA9|nr:ECF-type sigma factor [uncultured Paludibaculum sp.]